MPRPAGCPDLASYQHLAAGQLADADAEALLKHLENCEGCARKLNTLPEQETLVGLIRQARPLVDQAPGGVLARLVERLSKLHPGDEQAPEAPTVPPRSARPGRSTAFACPACGHPLKVQGERAGQKVRCPSCKETVPVSARTVASRSWPWNSWKGSRWTGA